MKKTMKMLIAGIAIIGILLMGSLPALATDAGLGEDEKPNHSGPQLIEEWIPVYDPVTGLLIGLIPIYVPIEFEYEEQYLTPKWADDAPPV